VSPRRPTKLITCILAFWQKQRITAKEQRGVPLFFVMSRHPEARVSAPDESPVADNFLEKQRKTAKRGAGSGTVRDDQWIAKMAVAKMAPMRF
jgi:hypothetical protein